MTALDDALESAKTRNLVDLEQPRDASHRRLLLRRLMQGAAIDFREIWWNVTGTWYSIPGDDDKDMWRYVAECVDATLDAWGYVMDTDETGGTR